MRTHTLGRAFGAILLTAAIAACSESPSAPSGPSVDGTWVGTWSSTDIRLTLHQSGSSVSGELEVGRAVYALTGDVDEGGRFSWSTELDQATCTAFSSSRFQLQDGGDTLAGLMLRGRRALPCGSGTRTEVTQGMASATRSF